MSALLITTTDHRATEQSILARRSPWLHKRNVTLLHEDTALVGFSMQSQKKFFYSELVIYFYCLISAVEKRKEQLGDTRQAGAKKKLGEWTDDDDDLLSLWNSELLINELLVGCMVLCSSPQV